jgi:large repetitive protein
MARFGRVWFAVCLLVSLSVFAQSADQQIVSITDTPDPVVPGNNVTYTVTVQNNGPDPATNGGVNLAWDGNLTYQSSSLPPGWTCTAPAQIMTCNTPSFAPSGPLALTFVAQVATHLRAFADGTVSMNVTTSGVTTDPNNGNNGDSETTAYDSPQVDLSLSATDSPDPVFPDGNVTYTVNLTNNGPDTASSVNFNVVPNSSLAFQSVSVPTGWSCPTTPPVGGINATFTCSRATWAPGSSQFIVVFSANDENFGILDTPFTTHFDVNAGASNETNHGNNQQDVTTQYTTPDADMNITATDSPDPVTPDGDITYTVTVTNQGPDAAPNAKMTLVGNGGQTRFVSGTTPAGWSCAYPAPGTLINVAGYECTIASLASGASAVFTIVTDASDDLHPNSDHNITQNFSTTSTIADPDGTDNVAGTSTLYTVTDADMNITATDSPDPVSPDGDITYTVTVTNQGPDTATNARMSIIGNGGQTRFVSLTAPGGWTCSPPAPGTLLNVANYDCTNPSFASGASAVFTVVTEASDDLHPNSDHQITQNFTTFADQADADQTDNTAAVSTLYDVPNADISVTNSDAPDPVSPGDTITYTQTITNNGPDTAANAAITQILPSSVGFQSITEPAGFTCVTPAIGASGTITCTNPSFANGGNASFTLVVIVNPAPGSTIGNTITGSSDASDTDPSDDTASVVTNVIIPVVADLGITKTTQSDGAAAGASVAYTITLTNNGPDAATNVVMSDTLPSELLFQSINVPAGFTCTTPAVGSTGTITCNAATLANGATATFTLIVQLTATAVGPINNTATATSDTDDNNGGNDSSGASPVAVGSNSTADLVASKSSATTTAAPGDTVTYTIAVTNNGPNPANDVIVNDELPASLLFQSIAPAATFTCTTPAAGSTGTITCLGGPLSNGSTATFTLVTTIAPGASGSIANGVLVATSDSDPVGSNSTDTAGPIVVATADLSITKTTPAAEAPTGSTITYTITVTNNGPDTAVNVVVNDDLPAGLQLVIATPSQGTCSATDPVSCSLGSLTSGASATITLQALVTATSGTISNAATVTADTDDGTPGNNTASSTPIPVDPGAAAVAQVPTLSEWALLALIAMLGIFAIRRI